MDYTITDWFAAIGAAIEDAEKRSAFWSAHNDGAARDRANRDVKTYRLMLADMVAGKVQIVRDVTNTVTLAEKARSLTDTIGRGVTDA